jgi:hypothetical protein
MQCASIHDPATRNAKGECISWVAGYKGRFADECAQGYYKQNGKCVPNERGGEKCEKDSDCASNNCAKEHKICCNAPKSDQASENCAF